MRDTESEQPLPWIIPYHALQTLPPDSLGPDRDVRNWKGHLKDKIVELRATHIMKCSGGSQGSYIGS